MKLYDDKRPKELPIVFAMCTRVELTILTNSLVEFLSKIDRYLEENADKEDLGQTHLHYRDCNKKWTKKDGDLVFYVDLNKR